MKKYCLLLFFLLIFLTGCSDENKDEKAIYDQYPALKNNDEFRLLGEINDYQFYYGKVDGSCEMEIDFEYGGYSFSNDDGCEQDFVYLDIYAVKDGVLYDTRELLDDGEITIEDYYQNIYLETIE